MRENRGIVISMILIAVLWVMRRVRLVEVGIVIMLVGAEEAVGVVDDIRLMIDTMLYQTDFWTFLFLSHLSLSTSSFS